MQVLRAVDLFFALKLQNSIRQICKLPTRSFPGSHGFLQQRQASTLKIRFENRMLHNEPRCFTTVFSDQAAPRPTMLLYDFTHPGIISLMDTTHFFGITVLRQLTIQQ